MTSSEIKATDVIALSERGWLKEIAYQLALMNEKPSVRPFETHSSQQRPPAVGASLSPPKQQVRR